MNNDAITRLAYYVPLSGYLKQAGDTKGYMEALENIVALKDSVAALNSTEAIAEMQAKYDVQQKEKTILQQELELARRNSLLYGSAGFIAMSGIIGWQLFRNQRRKQQEKLRLTVEEEKRMAAQSILEAEEKERKRIAADLHDNIGGYAAAIRDDVDRLSNEKRDTGNLQNLRHHSQEIINSLRDTIWVLNKDAITITGISDRFKNYVGKLMPSYPHINFQVDEKIGHDRTIPSRQALNVFRIMQEAVHNALKHSGADLIELTITSDDDLGIVIKDNGKGMPEDRPGDGHGLKNLEIRARESGMSLKIDSSRGIGTSVYLTAT